MAQLKRIIIGIDPGSRVTGYGIIWSQGSRQGRITFGQIKAQGESLNYRLQQIEEGLRNIIATHQPNEAAIEQVFTFHNHQSALKLGQARGAALVATAVYALPVSEYSARQIKQAVVGYGAATKAQVQHMIQMLLQLEKVPPADAADALAIALCHAISFRLTEKLMRA
ncbi:crossover junction endodeoxyribonuclease RuvC [Coxiella-like endosymbiont of Rhipicephalus sanguineus]|uniref:crossover junction endodeoxyribonuclease RuvC n=1 Tax=Coxiella-like endosymbiont of Rhipicephalus sanguineus TaxID=1955402 RepID=UPI0020420627|nr:crossover junction endodeoxyribonuclease RuvC [Coxiella-like endosymbiont of Rhipicephalus sanguineus]MBT8506613.1 crossover junction endodeoxyribonuclease RuvC [Coxiella-like endosymbiont of Rhipicephalus sanguineus]